MVTFCYPELAMAYTTDEKVQAAYRVTVRGEQAKAVAADVGCSRTTLRGWCKSAAIMDRVELLREQAPASRPPATIDPSAPIIDDITRRRLFDAIERGLPVPLALKYCGLSPKAPEWWAERADAGDAECRALLASIDRIDAEFAYRMMGQATGTESGAKNAQWALRCRYREFFGEHAPDKSPERSALDAYTDEQLDAIVAADA